MSFIGRKPTNAALTASDIADGILTADHLASNAVTTAKINADAVTDAKIADDVVGTEHLTAGEVDTTALGADAVTGAKIADDAIDSEHYTDGSIDTAHIADDQVTLAKMAGLARGKIIYGDASGNPAALAAGTNNYVLTSDGTDISWAEASGGTQAPHFSVYRTSDMSVCHNTWKELTSWTETQDSGSAFASNRFTPQTAGWYFMFGVVDVYNSGGLGYVAAQIRKNGSAISGFQTQIYSDNSANQHMQQVVPCSAYFYMNGSSDYASIWGAASRNQNGTTPQAASNTGFHGFKLII